MKRIINILVAVASLITIFQFSSITRLEAYQIIYWIVVLFLIWCIFFILKKIFQPENDFRISASNSFIIFVLGIGSFVYLYYIENDPQLYFFKIESKSLNKLSQLPFVIVELIFFVSLFMTIETKHEKKQRLYFEKNKSTVSAFRIEK